MIFVVCKYRGKPAIYDTVARVYYTCATMKRAKERAQELNKRGLK